jgi:hypothetical protein
MTVSKERKGEINARREQAIAMRARGVTLTEVSKALDYSSPAACFMDIKRALAERATTLKHTVDEYREQQIAQLEQLKERMQGVLDRQHVHISNGSVVRDSPLDENGDPMIDPNTGQLFAGEVITDDGPLVQAAMALLKIEVQLAKLTGTESAIKTEVTGKVNYVIEGVDMSKLS